MALTKSELIKKAKSMGVFVPVDWPKAKVQELVDGLDEQAAKAPPPDDGPASPRG